MTFPEFCRAHKCTRKEARELWCVLAVMRLREMLAILPDLRNWRRRT